MDPSVAPLEKPSSPDTNLARKRSRSPEPELEPQSDSKRQRLEPVRSSKSPEPPHHPKDPVDENSSTRSPTATAELEPDQPNGDQIAPLPESQSREPRRRVDEGQRAKRLFGALLNLNQRPDERKTKQRREIESRKKAELQQQDHRQIEDEQERLDRLVERRREKQKNVDEANVSGAFHEQERVSRRILLLMRDRCASDIVT